MTAWRPNGTPCGAFKSYGDGETTVKGTTAASCTNQPQATSFWLLPSTPVVRLFGVEGARGRAARDFRRYLGRRQAVCELASTGNEYHCSVDGQDLSRVVLFNGGGRASASATPELRALDQQARSSRVGIWRRGDDGDD